MAYDLQAWLRQQCTSYDFGLRGVLRRGVDQDRWPLHAASPEELEDELVARNLLLPLPGEPAALANVLEVSIMGFIMDRLEAVEGAEAVRGAERGYPDLEISGPAFGGGYHAVDVKAARLREYKRKTTPPRTQSRIALYTGNTYFKHPDIHFDGTLRAFGEYSSHLDLILIYRYQPDERSRLSDLEVIVQEPWRIASTKRPSTTREYIGAVDEVSRLREGNGEFKTSKEFYSYWRRFAFDVSPQVQIHLQRKNKAQAEEIARLRAQGEGGLW